MRVIECVGTFAQHMLVLSWRLCGFGCIAFFLFSTVRFVLPQQFFNRIGVAFLFGPEIADVD